jgi:hypothetical protein
MRNKPLILLTAILVVPLLSVNSALAAKNRGGDETTAARSETEGGGRIESESDKRGREGYQPYKGGQSRGSESGQPGMGGQPGTSGQPGAGGQPGTGGRSGSEEMGTPGGSTGGNTGIEGGTGGDTSGGAGGGSSGGMGGGNTEGGTSGGGAGGGSSGGMGGGGTER